MSPTKNDGVLRIIINEKIGRKDKNSFCLLKPAKFLSVIRELIYTLKNNNQTLKMAAMTQSPPVTTPVESTRTESFTLASSAYQSLKSLRNEGAHYKVIGSFLNSAEFVATRSVEVT